MRLSHNGAMASDIQTAPRVKRHTVEVHPVAGAIGAEIRGVDLSEPLDAGVVVEIRRAFLDHLVIFLRDQPLSPDRFRAFASAFGEPVEYPFVKGLEGFPEIIDRKSTRLNPSH